MNSIKRKNSSTVSHRNSPKSTIRGRLQLKLTQILRREKHRITHHHSAKLQTTKQTLTTLKHSNAFTYSNFPCHLKVNWDKLASSYRRWKCKKGKRLTITANFQERNLGTALSGKKISGPWAVSKKAGPVTSAWLANQMLEKKNRWILCSSGKNNIDNIKFISLFRRPDERFWTFSENFWRLPKTFEEDTKMFRSYTNEFHFNLRDKVNISEIIDTFTSEDWGYWKYTTRVLSSKTPVSI